MGIDQIYKWTQPEDQAPDFYEGHRYRTIHLARDLFTTVSVRLAAEIDGDSNASEQNNGGQNAKNPFTHVRSSFNFDLVINKHTGGDGLAENHFRLAAIYLQREVAVEF